MSDVNNETVSKASAAHKARKSSQRRVPAPLGLGANGMDSFGLDDHRMGGFVLNEFAIGDDEVLLVDSVSGKRQVVPRRRIRALPDCPPYDPVVRIEIWRTVRSRIYAYFSASGRLVHRDVRNRKPRTTIPVTAVEATAAA